MDQDKNRIQTEGRDANAAQPLNSAKDNRGAERYPAGDEARSFDRKRDNPEPRQGAGDSAVPTSANEGRMGPGSDPAEGKR